jgi:chemotaxis protein CheX
MVTGGAKRILGEQGYEFEMATPAVVSGARHTISHKVKGTRISVPFSCPDGTAVIEVCFEG